MNKEPTHILNQLRDDGYVYFRNASKEDLTEVLNTLGEVIQITDVKVNVESKALVTSPRGLDFHTDHHKADIIAWYCIKQSSEGGQSIFVDGEQIINKFNDSEKLQLSKIQLHEHKIFEDDKDSYPLIQKVENKYRLYYSFWLVNKNMNEIQNNLIKKFQAVIKKTKVQQVLLQPKDVLLMDNGRILHGRTEIKGDKDRFLKRFWISHPKFYLT